MGLLMGAFIVLENKIIMTDPIQLESIIKTLFEIGITNMDRVQVCEDVVFLTQKDADFYNNNSIDLPDSKSIMIYTFKGEDYPTDRLSMLSRFFSTHHLCGWPLTYEEKSGIMVPIHPSFRQYYYNHEHRWYDRHLNAMMNQGFDAISYVPMMIYFKDGTRCEKMPYHLLKETKTIKKVRPGLLLHCNHIPDPFSERGYGFHSMLVPTISITIMSVTKEGSLTALAIAHFHPQTKSMIRSQIAFEDGLMADDGSKWNQYYLVY